jgi:hypothetical protein
MIPIATRRRTMAETGIATSASSYTPMTIAENTASGAPPLAFAVAVWLGMPHDEIDHGLREGWVAPPPGMPADWKPVWASDEASGDSSNGDSTIGSQGSGNGDPQAGGILNRGGDGTGSADSRRARVDRAAIQPWFSA